MLTYITPVIYLAITRFLMARDFFKSRISILLCEEKWTLWHAYICVFSKANLLNNQFTSVFNIEDTSDIPVPSGPSYPSMPEFEINVCGVQKLLHTIKPNKASGPDSIPCRVRKEAANELAPALADIFNSSLSVGTLPDDWKTAHVAPAFKKGNTNAAENYRPISLTCVCAANYLSTLFATIYVLILTIIIYCLFSNMASDRTIVVILSCCPLSMIWCQFLTGRNRLALQCWIFLRPLMSCYIIDSLGNSGTVASTGVPLSGSLTSWAGACNV